MSPQRLADSAHVVPYPNNVGHYRDHQASSTSDSASRSLDTKPTRPRGRARHERPVRPEDEIRFNIGVPKPRPAARRRVPFFGSGQSGSRFPGEESWRNIEAPPGYDEAISTPPLSGCPSTVTLVTAATTASHAPSSLTISTTSGAEANPHNASDSASRANSPHPNSPGSDSGGSLSPPENISMEEVHDFPTPTQRSPKLKARRWLLGSHANDTQLSMSQDGPIEHIKMSSNLKRRNNALSPLRTLFSRSPQDAPLSALPTAVSPYGASRSTFSPFNSTTSLKASFSTVSLGRFGSNDGQGMRHRHIFSFKGKVRAKDLESEEREDTWEMVDPSVPTVDSNGKVVLSHHPKAASQGSSPAATPETSHSSLPKDNRPLVVQVHANPLSSERPASPSPAPSQLQSPARTAYSRDEKLRDMYMNIGSRRPANRPAPPQRTPSPPLTPEPQGPIVVTVRTRKDASPPSPSTPQTSPTPSGNRNASWVHQISGDLVYERALDTPLPDSPIVEASYLHHVAMPSAQSSEDHPPSREPSPSPSIRLGAVSPPTPQNPSTDPQNQTFAFPTTFDITRPSTPSSVCSSSTELLSPMRHHYPGRPLPRPPAVRNVPRVVDSTYAPFGVPLSSGEDPLLVDKTIPEGLLIDLDDELTESGRSRSSSSDSSTVQDSPVESQISSSTMRLAAFPLLPPSPPLSPVEASPSTLHRDRDPNPPSAVDGVVNGSGQSPYTEYTDLDLLVNRVSRDARDGSDYDALLLVSEFIGPATAGNGLVAPSNSNHCDGLVLQGRIDVERRRVTRDGRRKLKLSLLGVGVERCAICMSQFKEAEEAGMGYKCKHAFHVRCIGKWVAQGNRTCPLCRVQLDDE